MKVNRNTWILFLMAALLCSTVGFAATVSIQGEGGEVVCSGEKIRTQEHARGLYLSVANWIEKPFRVVAIAQGDFNPAAGLEYAVLGIRKDSNPQILQPGVYKLFIVAHDLSDGLGNKILSSASEVVNPEAVYTAPPMISVTDDVLIIENEFGSRERSFVTLRFRHNAEAKGLVLIGIDAKFIDTVKPNVKPQEASANLLTGQKIVNGKASVDPALKKAKITLAKCGYDGSIDLFSK